MIIEVVAYWTCRHVDLLRCLNYNCGIADYGITGITMSLLGLPWDYGEDCTRLQGSVRPLFCFCTSFVTNSVDLDDKSAVIFASARESLK